MSLYLEVKEHHNPKQACNLRIPFTGACTVISPSVHLVVVTLDCTELAIHRKFRLHDNTGPSKRKTIMRQEPGVESFLDRDASGS